MVRRTALIAVAGVAAIGMAAGPAAAASPTPRLGRTVVVKPLSGKVTVKVHHRRRFTLTRATAIPTGSTVDTTSGKVKLTSVRSGKRTQSGTFSKGAFVVTQQHDGLTDLKLTGGSFSVCSAAHAAGTTLSAAANRRRRLFGTAHGRFRTRGRNSSATVRGTAGRRRTAATARSPRTRPEPHEQGDHAEPPASTSCCPATRPPTSATTRRSSPTPTASSCWQSPPWG